MSVHAEPTVTVAIPAYQAERFIAETLESILAQTRPPDEVIVVDDGSTDGTTGVLEQFGDRIRVIQRDNGGCAAAFNTAFRAARGDYVAECGADDIWEPHKLERQVQALVAHPEVDIAFSAARVFGNRDGSWAMPAEATPSVGILDPHRFARTLYRENPVCPSTLVMKRALYERLGPFAEELPTEDYEYWMRALQRGAVFYYDAAMLVRYRRHDTNASSNHLAMRRTDLLVHRRYARLVDSPLLVRRVVAHDHFVLGRLLRDLGRTQEARAAMASSLRCRPTLRAAVWALLLAAPERYRERLSGQAISVRRALAGLLAASPWGRVGARAKP